MQKYQKPIARNLGDLQPVFGQCQDGQSARPGFGDRCRDGSGAAASDGACSEGNYAQGPCTFGTSPNFTPYPYG